MNVVVLCGFIENDVELRQTPPPGNNRVASFILRIDRSNKHYQFDHIKVVCWNALANHVSEFGAKGKRVEVHGSIRTDSRVLDGYDVFKDGEKIDDFRLPVYEIYAQNVEIL